MSHPALEIQNSHWASQVSEVAFGKRDELRVRDCLGQMFLLAPPKRCATCSTAFMHSLCSNNLCRSQSTNRMPALLCRGRCPLAGGPKNHKGPIAQQFQHNMAFGQDRLKWHAEAVSDSCLSWFFISFSLSLSLSHFLNEGRRWFHGCIWLSKKHGCIYGMDLGRCSQAPTLPLACSFLLMSLHQACLRHAQLLQAAAWFVKMYEQELPTKALWRLFSPSLSIYIIYTYITNTYIYICAVVCIYII